MRSSFYNLLLLAIAVLGSTGCSKADDIEIAKPVSQDELIMRGEALAETACASCHAIGKSGESQHAAAPQFRLIGQSYPIASLAEALAEGIMVGHPDMPEWKFEPADIEALLNYMESVQLSEAEADTALHLKYGYDLVAENCSSCHAIGPTGDSPRVGAPPLRTVLSSYDSEDLLIDFVEGHHVGPPEMPDFNFGPKGTDAIIAYLNSIQNTE